MVARKLCELLPNWMHHLEAIRSISTQNVRGGDGVMAEPGAGSSEKRQKKKSRKERMRKVQEVREGIVEIPAEVDLLLEKRVVEGILQINAEITSVTLDAMESVVSSESSGHRDEQCTPPPPNLILKQCLGLPGLTTDQRERLLAIEIAVNGYVLNCTICELLCM